MPFIPHTSEDTAAMLATIGAKTIDDLFDEIPRELLIPGLNNVASGMPEMQATRFFGELAKRDEAGLCFIGAGAYEHHIPAAVFEIATRGEFMTAYTPYQAEASQGTLQLLYEYQTMIASLMGLEVSNASLYDGATALAEAILMAVRANKHCKNRRILLPESVSPFYRQVVTTIVKQQNIEVTILSCGTDGRIDLSAQNAVKHGEFAALVIPQPNFFGVIEAVDTLTNWAHQLGALVIAQVNPTAMALLKEPGVWGEHGADIACGEGQALGIPLASGGPYFGFLTCRQTLVREMPGRIIGRTTDTQGREGFTLTLQAREQHIRRAKAKSNICTNQGLMVTAATIYLSLIGPTGLKRVAVQSHANTQLLSEKLCAIPGVARVFNAPFFHEMVITLPCPVAGVLDALNARGIQGGFDLSGVYPHLGQALLICATETKTLDDLNEYESAMREILAQMKEGAQCL